MPLVIVEEAPMLQTHSPSPQDDERNREYLIVVRFGENELKRRWMQLLLMVRAAQYLFPYLCVAV